MPCRFLINFNGPAGRSLPDWHGTKPRNVSGNFKRQKMTRLFFILTVSLNLTALTAHGQTLFFDNIKNSTWTAGEYFTDFTIRQAKKIGLSKLSYPTDSLKINKTIWTFNDSLTISFYDAAKKTNTIVAVYKYSCDRENGIFKMIINDKLTLSYKVGIASTGNHAILIRKKK